MKKKAQVYLLDAPQIKDGSIVSLDENQYERNKEEGYTDKILQEKGSLLIAKDTHSKSYHGFTPKHLYFTSDEEIKEGDWCIQLGFNRLEQWLNPNGLDITLRRKIVATINPELWYKGPFNEALQRKTYGDVAKIGDDFIEAYIKAYNNGKPITEVNLEYEDTFNDVANECFADIIPPKEWNLKLRSNGTVIISPVVEKFYSRDEVLDILMCFDTDSNIGHFNSPATRIAWFNKNYPQ